jgi:3' terminal RNA ribose 2'-O-methyltransferase Hen1
VNGQAPLRARQDLHELRLDTVLRELLHCGARSVLDLGCGSGELLLRLAREAQFDRIVGIDTSAQALGDARSLLQIALAGRVELVEASFAVPDARFTGFDAAALVETIEHVDAQRLASVERAVFGSYRPATVVITTPNSEYNPIYGTPAGSFRHPDHRFEWPRAKFRAWTRGAAARNGYRVAFGDIGEPDPELGASTQMAVLSRAN